MILLLASVAQAGEVVETEELIHHLEGRSRRLGSSLSVATWSEEDLAGIEMLLEAPIHGEVLDWTDQDAELAWLESSAAPDCVVLGSPPPRLRLNSAGASAPRA